ncbi:nucleotidyltransferase domain-containing protein [Methanospirillum hungatei]|uniref:nucleotidyltransferase domain-containing protein n=1 Tax=Methanospirillum hungatei TaxID=2203 RepID=UPI0026EB6AA2|nr:nucleotidyltransferase domain-containing protein [Methanospirillum hungatei]MCA1915320.1 nucleotidyltransferase domain-containing protein [Methanospirillum hungatei]
MKDTKPVVEDAISRYVSRVRDVFGGSISQILLFGSYARGEAGSESDIDIMVITKDPGWDIEYQLITMGYQIFSETGVMLSVKVRTTAEFEQASSFSFLRNVKQEGVLVG